MRPTEVKGTARLRAGTAGLLRGVGHRLLAIGVELAFLRGPDKVVGSGRTTEEADGGKGTALN